MTKELLKTLNEVMETLDIMIKLTKDAKAKIKEYKDKNKDKNKDNDLMEEEVIAFIQILMTKYNKELGEM